MQRRWESWRWGAQWLTIRSWQGPVERIIEADLLTTTGEIALKVNTDHFTVIWLLKQIGKVKNLNKWVPHELTKNQKKWSFWSVIFSYSMQQQWAVSCLTVTCDEKWILYDNQQWPAQWLDQKKLQIFPKSNLHQKKVMVTVWWSTTLLIHYSFLNPGKTITSEKYARKIDGMHWKL